MTKLTDAEPIEELDFTAMTMGQQLKYVRRSFYDKFSQGESLYCEDVYLDHPTLGNVLIVDLEGNLYSVAYTIATDGTLSFAERLTWIKMMMTYVPVDNELKISESNESLSESNTGHAVELVEATKDETGPVKLRIVPIMAGPGNKRDNHYYPLDVIKRDISVFEGAKMYATDHKPDEKNTLTEVATVIKAPDGFAESGEPYALVGIHDPNFAQSVRNRAELGTLDKLNVSILGQGDARPGKIGETSYKIVESIKVGKAIDFVTSAGAGGHAVNLAESEENVSKEKDEEKLEEVEIAEEGATIEDAPVTLTEDEIKAILTTSGLQEVSQSHLGSNLYADEAALRQAILVEKQYLSTIIGAGKPVDMGESSVTSEAPVNASKRKEISEAARAKVNVAVFGGTIR